MEAFKNLIEILHNLVVMAAAVIGGFWVLNRLKRERTDEAALEMKVTPKSSRVHDGPRSNHLVLFTVELANKGKTKIEAKSEKTGEYVFCESGEQAEELKYPCSLQFCRLDPNQADQPQPLNWFSGGAWQNKVVFQQGREVNVLVEYENPELNDKVEFWMEPGETYRLGVPVILEKGVYLGKLTFVAAKLEKEWLDKALEQIGLGTAPSPIRDENFWSQIFAFEVPTPAKDNEE